ncbi:LysR family transcriptional regulator [Mesorhizobium australafricanum]|uniref:LysR family transcriptional regulator n=1 Tax=Mesorhizobium australafricanum TaxID=3072311 RepID=A0ABU4X6F6_9HYPH|nr:LysR family transcriptional regulator [Mesorhizobium sp. VK3E]MDX8443906.1 LysR family transcriptional regulator [Mesorhizobium sp. VK3E]
MDNPFYGLPCLSGLEAFEAFARRRSLKLGASELGISPDVAAQQIKSVEKKLGVSFLAPSETGLTLTEPGEDLYRVLADTYSRVAEVVAKIRREGLVQACDEL